MVFWGVFAMGFYTLILGAAWPARDGADLSEGLLGLVGKSLWLAWAVVAVSLWLDLPSLHWLLLVAVLIALLLQRQRRIRVTHPLAEAIAIAVTVCGCVFLYFGGFDADYRLIFGTWDSLASWNRWALELYANEFRPYDAAYPILFPALWALVYKAQGADSIWYFAKLTQLVIPLILGLLVVLLIGQRRYLSALWAAVFILWFFFLSGKAYAMFIGNMDIPVAAMVLAAGTIMALAARSLADGRPAEETRGLLVLAAVFTGLAAMTKQPGIVLLAPMGLLIGYGVKTDRVDPGTAVRATAAALLPLVSFLAIFLTRQRHPLGNVDNLARIARESHPGQTPVEAAAEMVLGMGPLWLLAAIAVLAGASLLRLRSLEGWFALALVLVAAGGFFIFAWCCSYEPRNGWWIVSLVAASAMCTTLRLDSRWAGVAAGPTTLRAAWIPAVALGFVLLGAWMVADRLPWWMARDRQLAVQWEVAGPQIGPMVEDHLVPQMQAGDLLLSEIEPAKWLPTMRTRFVLCGGNDVPCVDAALASPGRIFVLIHRGLLEFPALEEQLQGKLIVEDSPYALYGPLDDGGGEGATAGGAGQAETPAGGGDEVEAGSVDSGGAPPPNAGANGAAVSTRGAVAAAAVIDLPYQLFLMMPFVFTIVARAAVSRSARPPAALLVPFRKEER